MRLVAVEELRRPRGSLRWRGREGVDRGAVWPQTKRDIVDDCQARRLARHAEHAGADAVAAVPPIYFKVTWPVIRDCHARLVDACRLPV
jgi:hypothetical protein